MAQTVRTLETGIANPEPGPEAHSLPCEVVRSDEELSNGICVPGFSKMDTEGQEAIKRSLSNAIKSVDWRRNANRKVKVCSLLRLCIWIQFIAVPFYLWLSRIDNPGPAHTTAKLFVVQFEAIGQWAANLTSKSEMELTPLLTQVGKCRQMFSESFEKESHPYTSSVTQNIQSIHSHTDSLLLPVSTEPGGDSAHTQQFSNYLSLFQAGKECDSECDGSRHVSAQMQFCDRSDKLRDNSCCYRSQRGVRKHTGKKRKLEIAQGMVNIRQCNVTSWSEHAKHYILTSDFDGAHLEREKFLMAAKEARKFSWAGTGSAATSTASNGTSAGVLALVRTRWFSKPLSICTDEAGFLCPNPRLAGRVTRVMGRAAYFEHSVGFRSDVNANLIQDVCFLTIDGKVPFILGADFNFPPNLWQDLPTHGGSLWLQKLGASVVVPEGTTHTCRVGKGQKPDIIDYFLGVNTHQTSDTEMRHCEVGPLGSALRRQACARASNSKRWCPGQLMVKFNKPDRHQHERAPRFEHATH